MSTGNMDNDSAAVIRKKVKDGSYFTEARDWYARKYLAPISQRSLLTFLSIVCLCLPIYVITSFEKHLSSEKEIPIIIRVDNATDYFSHIKPLSLSGESSQDAVANYLVSEYLKIREEYYPSKMSGPSLKSVFKRVKSSSSKGVFDDYKEYMSPNNEYSPLARYNKKITRTVSIDSIRFTEHDRTSGKAKISFTAIEQRGTKILNTSQWRAAINFQLSNITTIAKRSSSLRFIVRYYKVEKVNGGKEQK